MNTWKTLDRGSHATVPPDLSAPDKLLVYVASPFAGDVERNIMKARRYFTDDCTERPQGYASRR